MEQVKVSQLQQALDLIGQLPPEDQQALIDLVHHRLVESRRAEIADNAAATLQDLQEGRVRYGSLDDLKHDLLAEK